MPNVGQKGGRGGHDGVGLRRAVVRDLDGLLAFHGSLGRVVSGPGLWVYNIKRRSICFQYYPPKQNKNNS